MFFGISNSIFRFFGISNLCSGIFWHKQFNSVMRNKIKCEFKILSKMLLKTFLFDQTIKRLIKWFDQKFFDQLSNSFSETLVFFIWWNLECDQKLWKIWPNNQIWPKITKRSFGHLVKIGYLTKYLVFYRNTSWKVV